MELKLFSIVRNLFHVSNACLSGSLGVNGLFKVCYLDFFGVSFVLKQL